jgi:hypothetical protein
MYDMAAQSYRLADKILFFESGDKLANVSKN